MKIFENVTKSLSDALDYVVEKNRVNAQINRLKIVMRHEAKVLTKSYVKLGKYYYENLRDTANEENEALCKNIDVSSVRLEQAQKRYAECKNACSKEKDEANCCEKTIVKENDTVDNPMRDESLDKSVIERITNDAVQTAAEAVSQENPAFDDETINKQNDIPVKNFAEAFSEDFENPVDIIDNKPELNSDTDEK